MTRTEMVCIVLDDQDARGDFSLHGCCVETDLSFDEYARKMRNASAQDLREWPEEELVQEVLRIQHGVA